MRGIYWRPSGVSNNVLATIAGLAVAGLVVVQIFPTRTSESYYLQMLEAATLARRTFDELKKERASRRIDVHPVADPTLSGLIGISMSEVTTNTGYLPAKQTTVNPNWAAVVVHLLKEAGVRPGDTVAVGLSGSFAAINVSVYAALEAQKLRPIVITSASSSQWGANHPRFLWLDMERVLFARKLVSFRSVAATLGGAEDRALGLSEEGIRLLERAIRRNKIPMIAPENYAESVVERMRIYREHANGAPIRAYLNVGGSTASVGTSRMKVRFQPGLNERLPSGAATIDSVMARFLEEGVPVIHFVQVDQLARRYGLPLQPTELPPVGTGQIFLQRRYNPVLASGVLAAIVASLFLFVRSGRGRMAFQRAGPSESTHLQPRV